jgi:hypothetical protein
MTCSALDPCTACSLAGVHDNEQTTSKTESARIGSVRLRANVIPTGALRTIAGPVHVRKCGQREMIEILDDLLLELKLAHLADLFLHGDRSTLLVCEWLL